VCRTIIDLLFYCTSINYLLNHFSYPNFTFNLPLISSLYNLDEASIDETYGPSNIEIDDKKLTSFVFERDESYKVKGITKDGIHIQFPFIITYPSVQYYIRDNILKKIGDVISDMGLKNIIPDIVDRSVISPNTLWLLYGSNKDKPKGNPYKLKYMYTVFKNFIDYTKCI
jgi:hypothetical protein